MNGADDETLNLMFQLFDHNNDKKIDKQDLKSLFLFQNQVLMIVDGKKQQEIKLRNKEIDKIVKDLFAKTDTDDSGDIDYDEFKKLMETNLEKNQFLVDELQKNQKK